MIKRTLLLSLALLLSVACQKQDDTEIRVGSFFPMTGPIATYGQESVNGIQLALKKINAAGVKGKQIKLINEDNKGEPAESANAVRKLIDINKVHVVLGAVASSNTLAAAPIAQQSKVPLLTPASTNEKVTKTGDFISRTCFTDDFQGVVMAKFAYETLGKKKAVIIVDNSSDYSKGLASVFRPAFTDLGGTVVSVDNEMTYTQKDTDFRTLLQKVKRAEADVVFLPGYYSEVGLILKQAREMGLNIPFLGGDGWDSPKLQELAGEGISGNYISSHFSAEDSDPKVQEFVKEYQAAYGQLPGAMAALGYDGIMVIADAINRASSLDHAAIRDAIIATKDFVGITGSITIDENRNARKSAVVLETTATGMAFKQKVSP
jgi:branched-chain amino acid transport system substrate-binding protein